MRSGGTRWLAPCSWVTPDNRDGTGAGTGYPCSHGSEQQREVADLRFQRTVLQSGDSVCQGGGHQQVFSGGHRGYVKGEMGPAQATGPGLDITSLDADFRAQGFQPGNMFVDRSGANRAAPRQGHIGFPEAGQQGSQQEDGSADGFDQVIGRMHRVHLAAVDLQFGAGTLRTARRAIPSVAAPF